MVTQKYLLLFALMALLALGHCSEDDEKAKKGPKITDKVSNQRISFMVLLIFALFLGMVRYNYG